MKSFNCGALVPGCSWHTRSDNEADLVDRVVRHLRTDHGETVVRPAMVDQIRARITDVPEAAKRPAA